MEGSKESEIIAMISQTPSQSKAPEYVTHDTPPETDDLPVNKSNRSSSVDHLSKEEIITASDAQMGTSGEET